MSARPCSRKLPRSETPTWYTIPSGHVCSRPARVENPAAVVELAKAAFGDDNQTAQYITALGAALYRAGKCEEAAERLGKLASRWEEGNRELDATSPVYAMCFLAMAHYRLGHAEEALKWLEKANVQSADEAIAGWNRRFTLQMLRHEAGRLLQREKE